MRKVGKGLKDLVGKRGLTQGQIAQRSGQYRDPPFSRSYINKILNGAKVPPDETLEIIMRVLKCKLIGVRVAVEINEDGTLGEQYYV